jgi:glycosyltransferase involved in cell wall biosynthesis
MTVQVLLSTFNGAAYLPMLMESLLAQDYPHVSLLIRDDGSSDKTVSLLREYAQVDPKIVVVPGEHEGFIRSFFRLLDLSSPEADYVAFCDQDDVWHPDKISRATEFLSRCRPETPALYCSRLAVVDEHLNPLGLSGAPTRGLSFRNALVECPVAGCTVLLNQAARRLLMRKFPQHAYSHDWWMYLVVSAFGTMIYDDQARILYRNHPANVFGITLGAVDAWRVKFRRFLKTGRCQPVTRQAEEFRRIYGASLSDENRAILDRFLEGRQRFSDRLRYAFSCDVYRQSAGDDFILKGLIAFNRL